MAPAVMNRWAVAALVVAAAFCPVSGCAHPSPAYADEFIVLDDYATRSDVSRLDGSVSALTGSVSSGLSAMQDDVGTISRDMTTLLEGEQGEKADVDAIRESTGKAVEGIEQANQALDVQGQKLDELGASLDSMRSDEGDAQVVEQLTTDELLALVPEDASGQITEYMQYPFIMGMASGIIAYVISLVAAGVYRLLGFK